jgi:hypothetical protein
MTSVAQGGAFQLLNTTPPHAHDMRGQSLDFWVRARSDIILRFVLQGISFEACWGAGGCVGSRMGLRDGSLGFEEL